jgi:hypothetical protein
MQWRGWIHRVWYEFIPWFRDLITSTVFTESYLFQGSPSVTLWNWIRNVSSLNAPTVYFITNFSLRDFRLPPRSTWELRSSGLLPSEYWQFLTEVAGQPFGPIFKGQWSWLFKMGPIGCPETSVRSYHYYFGNGPEEHISDLQSLYANYGGMQTQMKLVTFMLFLIVQHLECSFWVPPNTEWDVFCVPAWSVRPATQFAYIACAASPSYPNVTLLYLYTRNNINCVLCNDIRVPGYDRMSIGKYYPLFLRSLLPPASGSTQHKMTTFLSTDTALCSMRLESLSAQLWDS